MGHISPAARHTYTCAATHTHTQHFADSAQVVMDPGMLICVEITCHLGLSLFNVKSMSTHYSYVNRTLECVHNLYSNYK